MQRRVLLPVVAVVLLALAGLGVRARALAQEATPTQNHPLVGTWLVDTDPADPANALDTFLFSADGGYVDVEAGGDTNVGAWEATGDATANLTIQSAEGDDEGNNLGTVKIRAAFEVDAGGDSLTAEYTIEFIQPDGTSGGEAGPGQATGERLVVEAPGTPTMTIEELFGQFEGESEGTPAP